jgi:hypothetical protein
MLVAATAVFLYYTVWTLIMVSDIRFVLHTLVRGGCGCHRDFGDSVVLVARTLVFYVLLIDIMLSSIVP